MADYVSSLNGSQMDQALIDMAEHNSEAWAVGERNGVPVGSDDVTYQNNAQYYAQQAQSIAPASVTEAVRWDIAQTALTDANKAQARTNIDAGKNGAWSNRNLLDNAYFVGGGSQLGDGVFPINQRGQSSYASAGSCIDRWKTDGNFTISASGVSQDTTKAAFQMTTRDFFARLLGKTLTASLLLADGTIKSGTVTMPASFGVTTSLTAVNDGSHYAGVLVYDSGNGQLFRFYGANIAAVKLELGTVSTLANDAPPDFGEELRKCQRYLYVLDAPAYHFLGEVALAGDATNCTIGFHLPAEMRTTAPSVTLTSGLWVGGAQITAVNWTRTLGTTVIAACTVTGGLSGSTLYAVATGASATTITISAEL